MTKGRKEELITLVQNHECMNGLRLADELLRETPQDVELLALKADCLVSLGDKEPAWQLYREIKRLDPKSVHGELGLGIMHASRRAYKKALQHFNKAFLIDPRHAPTYYHRSLLYFDNGTYNKALSDLDQLEGLVGRAGFIEVNRGSILNCTKDLDGAIRAFTRALNLAASPMIHATAHYNRAVAAMQLMETADRQVEKEDSQAFELASIEGDLIAASGLYRQLEDAYPGRFGQQAREADELLMQWRQATKGFRNTFNSMLESEPLELREDLLLDAIFPDGSATGENLLSKTSVHLGVARRLLTPPSPS